MRTYMGNQLIATLWLLGAIICKSEGLEYLIRPCFMIAGWYYFAAMLSYWLSVD